MAQNIILLTIDALRADHLSCYGYGRETTPHIDNFANASVLFENAFSASSHTREALPAILTGRYPEEAVTDDFRLGAPTIATHLRETHSTAAFHSNPYVSRAYGFDKDFDKFYDDLFLGRTRPLALLQRAFDKFVFNRGEYHTRAAKLNERALDWIDSTDRPLFVWNHYMDVHGPYNPPEEFNYWADRTPENNEAQQLYDRCTSNPESISDDEQQLLIDLYDGEIRYLDSEIGAFLTALERRDLLSDSVVMLTADHGELFGEHGKFAHPRYMYTELLRIPYILYSGSIRTQGGTEETPVSTLDIVPTLLSMVDGPDVAGLPGKQLPSGLPDSRIVYSSALGEGEDAAIRRFLASNGEDTVSLARDGDENYAVEIKQASDGNGGLIDELKKHSAPRVSNDTRDEDIASEEMVEDRLEALGYK